MNGTYRTYGTHESYKSHSQEIFHRRRREILFSNRRLLKGVGLRLGAAGLALMYTMAANAQSSRAESAASYFARGREWHARGDFNRAIADYGIAIIFDPR